MDARDIAAKAALVALLRSDRCPGNVAELLESGCSARALVGKIGGEDEARPRLFSSEGDQMQTLLDTAASDVAHWEAEGIRTLSVVDGGYPENLRAVHDRPPLVFVSGRLQRRDARSVAVIGSRKASPGGLRAAAEVGEHLSATGYTVVSGLADGVDRAAHCAALRSGGRTVAVIGTGLRRCYPAANAVLQSRIAREGAVVSQFWPDDPPSRTSFPLRNAVMSGISLATVIVEAGATSGARVQARLALGHGRPVFMLEPVLAQPWAEDLVLKPGVYVVRRLDEITSHLERLASGELVG